jgi:hypothetical protein
MGGSYRQCDACGKRALSIANQCPGCGREFPAREVPKGGGLEMSRFLSPKAVAAVLAGVAVLASARVAWTDQPLEEKKAEIVSSVARTGPEAESFMAMGGPVETAKVAALPVESRGELRVVQNWTEVRKSRSASAPVEAVLMPGDTVLADSLAEGWFRVKLEGEVLGYADRSVLAALR